MEKNPLEMTWEELHEVKPGTILHDEIDEGVRFIIMRGPAALCAYVGVPSAHPAAGLDYNDVPLRCHWGLTFAGEGSTPEKPNSWPAGWFWYGWDYGHCDDASFWDVKERSIAPSLSRGKQWTVKEVKDDSWSTVYDFQKYVKGIEQVAIKAMKWRPS